MSAGKLGSLTDLTVHAVSSIQNTTNSTQDGLDISDVENANSDSIINPDIPTTPPVSLWNKFKIMSKVKKIFKICKYC